MKQFVTTIIAIITLACGALAAEQSIDRLKLTKADLPEGYELGTDIRAISIQPVTFYDKPDQMGLLPMPVKKAHQELRYKGATRGTLMMFQYKNADEAGSIEGFLKGLLWGEPTGPSEMHPEELYVADNVIFVFCFGYRSDESQLVKDILREKKGVAIGGPVDPFKQVITRARRYYNKDDAKKGIAYLKKEYDVIKDRSFGQYFMAEFYYMVHDWAGAGEHYRLALDLHGGKDPLPDKGSLWACNHGMGISCAMTGRVKESVDYFTASLDIARGLKEEKMTASSAYDLSCSYAVLNDLDRSCKLLSEAIRLDGKYKVMAREDECFKQARAEKRFAELLK